MAADFIWQWCGLAGWLGSTLRGPHIVNTSTTSSQGKGSLQESTAVVVLNRTLANVTPIAEVKGAALGQ